MRQCKILNKTNCPIKPRTTINIDWVTFKFLKTTRADQALKTTRTEGPSNKVIRSFERAIEERSHNRPFQVVVQTELEMVGKVADQIHPFQVSVRNEIGTGRKFGKQSHPFQVSVQTEHGTARKILSRFIRSKFQFELNLEWSVILSSSIWPRLFYLNRLIYDFY